MSHQLVTMAMLISLIKILLIIAGVEQNPGPIVAPNIKTGIDDQTVILGEPWEYKLHIGGDSPFNVKVTKNTIELPATGHVEYSWDKGVVCICIKNIEVTDEGLYQIEVSNGSGDTASCAFKITVHQFNFRYQYLLVETGTKVLRRLLDSKVGHDLDNYLRTNPSHSTTLQTLINGKKGVRPAISVKQAELLPPKDNDPKSEKFDITLLTCLLRNICNLKPPSHSVWQNKPSVTDLSEEAYIMRLKNCRNNLSHSGTVRFPATEFAEKWKELSETLLALNKFCGKDYIVDLTHTIDSVKEMVIDETARELLTEIIKNWNATENDLKEDIERVEEIAATNLHEIRAVKRKLDDIAETCLPNKNMKLDIQGDLVNIYMEDCSTLPVSPLCYEDDDAIDLLTVYQAPTMTRVPYHKRDNHDDGTYSVTSYQQLFYKGDRQFRNIYITGDAGVGKTSLCQCMALLWCKSQKGEKVSNESMQRDIDFMSKFEFLFFCFFKRD